MSWVPESPPVNPTPDILSEWLMRQFISLSHTLDMDDLQERNTVPDKPRTGKFYLADGTDWDPGSGQGVYVYYNGTYNYLG